jgi:hypothetical protein
MAFVYGSPGRLTARNGNFPAWAEDEQARHPLHYRLLGQSRDGGPVGDGAANSGGPGGPTGPLGTPWRTPFSR